MHAAFEAGFFLRGSAASKDMMDDDLRVWHIFAGKNAFSRDTFTRRDNELYLSSYLVWYYIY